MNKIENKKDFKFIQLFMFQFRLKHIAGVEWAPEGLNQFPFINKLGFNEVIYLFAFFVLFTFRLTQSMKKRIKLDVSLVMGLSKTEKLYS
jgi:hypothetical protein